MRVPFPHVERAVLVPRPALVVSARPLGPSGSLMWTLMVTNRDHAPWSGDVEIPEAAARGLLIPSKIRTAKIATSECATAAAIGRLDDATLAMVLGLLRGICG